MEANIFTQPAPFLPPKQKKNFLRLWFQSTDIWIILKLWRKTKYTDFFQNTYFKERGSGKT